MSNRQVLTPEKIEAKKSPRRAVAAEHERLIRRPEVETFTGLSRSNIYDWMKRGKFPQPVKLGARLVAWRESGVSTWLENCETRVA